MGRLKDETGNKYGKLTVVERAGKSKSREALWRCECECGGETIASGVDLRSGHTKSCGCVGRKARAAYNAEKKLAPGEVGACWITTGGYRRCYVGTPTGAEKKLEHRIVMEAYCGAPIEPDTEVHHIDFDKLNNDISNLICLSTADHKRLHEEAGDLKSD